MIAGPVPDREFTAGGKAMKLSRVVRLEPGRAGKAVTVEGESVPGPLAGLDGVEMKLGDRVVRIDLAKADAVDLVPPAEPAALTCTAVATAGGKEIGRATEVVPLPGAGRAAGPAAIAAAALEADRVTRKLPDTFSDVCAGGGGRYLLFGLPKQGKVAVFDISLARIVHYFPAPDPAARFAAGADKVVIALPGPRVLQRWSLATFERELSVPFPAQEPIASLLLGHASHGPVVANGTYLDLGTLKPLDVKGSNGRVTGVAAGRAMASAVSADGTVIGATSAGGISPSGLHAAVLTGNTVKTYYQHTSPGYVAPSADGRWVFTIQGAFTNDLKPVAATNGQHPARFVPAVQGTMYLGLRPSDPSPRPGGRAGQPATELSLYLQGESRPLAQLGTVADDLLSQGGGEPLALHKRVWLVPDAKVLVTLPATRDAVHLTRFDLDEALEKAGTDYLFVVSDPPTGIRRGGRYAHQLVVKSKRGRIRCKLDSGPAGMTVTAAGGVEWQVPADFAGETATVIVSVADASGQEVFKSFTIKVGG